MLWTMNGKDLKIARIKLDLTQAQLAQALDLNPNTISRYEQGDLKVSRVLALAIEALEARQARETADTKEDVSL